MSLKIKAFIYRFFMVFGVSVYLADKEEQQYIDSLKKEGKLQLEGVHRGSWQAKHGFLSVWTYKQNFIEATWNKIKNVFRS